MKLKVGDKVMFLRYSLDGKMPPSGMNWAEKAGLILMQIYEVQMVFSDSILLKGKEYWHNAGLFLKVEEKL